MLRLVPEKILPFDSSWKSFKPTLIFLSGALLFFSYCSNENKKQTADGPFFKDITDKVNLDFIHNPGVDGTYYMPESIGSGAAFLDYDNDGDLDIYLVNCGYHSGKNKEKAQVKNQLFRQEKDGSFINVTRSSGLGDTGYGMGVAAGDYDNDGNCDTSR